MDTALTNLIRDIAPPPLPGPTMEIASATFFGVRRPVRVRDNLRLTLTECTYLPKADSPRSDWVVTAALPAFRELSTMYERNGATVDGFCAVGTGAAVDVLAAVETLSPRRVVVTDLHADVVENAVSNIKRNLRDSELINIAGCVGNLGTPLHGRGLKFDLIYENLPNIALRSDDRLYRGRTSSSFCALRPDTRPAGVERNLLGLHYDMLQDAKRLLTEGGRILCVIGSRIAIDEILAMPAQAGFEAKILTYAWKIQSEAEEVVSGYLASERDGHGPFHYYPIEVLERFFARLSPSEAALHAREVEAKLEPYRLDGATAWRMVKAGVEIGHTVTVIEATQRT